MVNHMKEKKYDLLCVGTAIVDCIIKGFQNQRISKTGFAAQSTMLSMGGESINQAVVAGRLGLRVGLLCGVGRDGGGEFLRSALEQQGVDTSLLVAHAGDGDVCG